MARHLSLWYASFSPPHLVLILFKVGHSLGGALAELDCMFMTLNLPSNIAIKGVTYGTPRVGNSAWATLFDATVRGLYYSHLKSIQIPSYL